MGDEAKLETRDTATPRPLLARLDEPRVAWSLFALLALGCIALYWPALGTGLLSDDWALSHGDAPPWSSLWGHWFGGGQGAFYRPLPRLAVWAQAAAFGHDGLAQHVVSLALHLVAGAWVLWGLRAIGRPVAGLVACAVGLLHPAAVETVAWVSSQTDLWHGAFALGALATLSRANSWRWIATSGALAVGATLSKETALLLGPFAVAGLLYAALWARPEGFPRGRLLAAAAMHATLWIGYLAWRAWRLGAALPPPMGEPTPALMAANLVAALHALLAPLLPTVEPSRLPRDLGAAGVVLLAALPAAALALAITRRHVAALATLLLAGALVPAIRTLEDPAQLTGSMRFLTHPLWFAAILAGLGADAILRAARARGAVAWRVASTLLAIGAAVAIARGASQARGQMQDFVVAAQVRDAIEAELREKVAPEPRAALVPSMMPDRVGGAYVFRNGFEEFAMRVLGRAPRVVRDPKPAGIRPGDVFFAIVYAGPGSAPFVRRDEALSSFRERQQEPRAAAPALRLDFSDPAFPNERLPLSADLRLVGAVAGARRFEATGPDPNVGIYFPGEATPAAYRTLTITLEFIDPPPGAPEDVLEVVFLPDDDVGAVTTLSQPIRLVPGRQTVRVELHESIQWLGARRIKWLRLDPCTRHRGQLDLVEAVYE